VGRSPCYLPPPVPTPAGSPEGALQAIPGVGLHWYVHTTRAPVKYWLQLPDGSTSEGQGVAHMEKNWGASFPR